MAVQDLWRDRHGNPTARDGRGKRWRVTVAGHPSKAFMVKRDAVAWEAELLSSERAYGPVVTVGELLDKWLAGKAHLPKSSGAGLAAARVRGRWGHVNADEVQPHEVQAWLSGLEVEHRRDGGRVLVAASVSTRRKSLQALAGAMDIGVTIGAVVRNPCDGARVGKDRTREARFLTVAELQTLAYHAGSYGPMVWLLGTTGLRLGECVALDVSDVAVKRGRLRVRRAKSGRGRDVPVPVSVLGMLDLSAPGPLFRSPAGGRVDSDNWRARVFRPAAEAAGLGGVRIHDLRHTAASLAISSGADVKAVQNMLGHATAAMTLDVYGHLFDRGLDDVAARMDRLIS